MAAEAALNDAVVDSVTAEIRMAATAYINDVTTRRRGLKPPHGEELALKAAFCAGADYGIKRRSG
jgi:hypothetical protein